MRSKLPILRFVKRLNFFSGLRVGRAVSTICSQDEFLSILVRERSRSERSGQPFSLVVFDVGDIDQDDTVCQVILDVLCRRLRSTDEVGWVDENHIGVLLHNTPNSGAYIFTKNIVNAFPDGFPTPDYSVQTFPMEIDIESKDNGTDKQGNGGPGAGSEVSPLDLATFVFRKTEESNKPCEKNQLSPIPKVQKRVHTLRPLYLVAMPPWKRMMDILGSSAALLLLSPLLLGTALYIKFLSPGPVFFRQKRVGYDGKLFTMLKFRTMSTKTDSSGHRKYLKELIRPGKNEKDDKPMTKLEDPSVIIRGGKILRACGIDELPQLVNVLRGEMSLVGPRPPIGYEVQEYVRWHSGRFDAVPGLTGLWQVSGKNRLTFREMARLDIRYSRQLSFWLDIKILLLTPFAVLSQLLDLGSQNVKTDVRREIL